jgi:hypothetical protein
LTPDAWQRQVLEARPRRALLRCSRQSGKSTTAAAAALDCALSVPRSLVLLVSPSLRQSSELHHRVRELLVPLHNQPGVASTKPLSETVLSLRLRNKSRILSLPSSESTIRGYSPRLIVLDEAAHVPDSLVYGALWPMLATGGRLLALSTPRGRRGFFFDAWTGPEPWVRVKVAAHQCPRISAEVLEEARRTTPSLSFSSEYMVEFTEVSGSVFASADVDAFAGIERAVS